MALLAVEGPTLRAVRVFAAKSCNEFQGRLSTGCAVARQALATQVSV